MKKSLVWLSKRKNSAYLVLCFSTFFYAIIQGNDGNTAFNKTTYSEKNKTPVIKHVLANGLTVLIRPTATMQKVAVELWVGVGAKHEDTGEKGIAHLIEHMLFKGTEKLSESDLYQISDKFSGYMNAMTGQDWTKILMHFPLSSWKITLPLLADIMQNCTFKEELLNSELKTVVQELKMYRDDFMHTLYLELKHAIYPDHPYQFPTIGFKQDLWNVHADALKAFYKKHYVPHNAILIIVGNVDSDETLALVEETFGTIPSNNAYQQPSFYVNKDIKTQHVTLYRNIEKPLAMLAFVIPGIKECDFLSLDVITSILFSGKTSRVYKKLIDNQLADSLSASPNDMFDTDIFSITIEPRNQDYCDKIKQIILNELKSIADDGCSPDELKKILKQYLARFYQALESNAAQASFIADYYLATRNENFLYDIIDQLNLDEENLRHINEKIKTFAKTYFRPSLMHQGYVLPLPHEEKEYWQKLQQRSDDEDARILNGRIRNSPVEPGKYVHTIADELQAQMVYPKQQIRPLKNGIRLITYQSDHIPLIRLDVNLKDSFDPDLVHKGVLISCLSALLGESGTSKRSADELAQAFEHEAISYDISTGGLSATMLANDLAYALPLLYETLSEPIFDEATLVKVKAQSLAAYEASFDDEGHLADNLMESSVYQPLINDRKDAHYPGLMSKITLEDIIETYKKTVSPDGATIIIVGNFKDHEAVYELCQQTFGTWQGPQRPEPACFAETTMEPTVTTEHIDRDQVILKFAGASINRFDPDYNALTIYDTHLNSRLHDLRQLTGAFYSIEGSTRGDAGFSPGLASLSTQASLDRLDEITTLLENFIERDIDAFNDDDLHRAKQTILKDRDEAFDAIDSLTNTFAFLHTYDLPSDYFDTHNQQYESITVDDVKRAVKRVFNPKTMSRVLVGRIGIPDTCSQASIEPQQELSEFPST